MFDTQVSYRYPSKIKTLLRTAHGELRERGFLIVTSYEKAKNPTVRYHINDEFVRRRSWPPVSDTTSDTSPVSPTEEEAYQRLREHRVWPMLPASLSRKRCGTVPHVRRRFVPARDCGSPARG